ncbi:CotY/CotZ family spore coat protein [Rummeliibacillus pycnus]|uniref:CotY/CotZ family spore coat protein n=1 Tax=Rummeliibacillus pycnus TaxID=101070 RepID=UPI0037C94663
MSVEDANKHCLCEALLELKKLQDMITNLQTKYYGELLLKLVGTDTIPFFLITNNGCHFRFIDTDKQFETEYFRIESIDRELCCATVSLLRALDFEGHDTFSICDVVKLEKTRTKRSIDLECISGIQLLSPDLLIRKILCEPKW